MGKRMKTRRKKLLIFIVIVAAIVVVAGVCVLAISIISARGMSMIPSMSFEDVLAYTTKDNANAVITVGIVKDGKSSFNVYGENAAVLPNKEYEYEIGSVTKTFTASLLCKALSEGKIRLEDSIDRYLELPAKEYYPTLKRLVTHTSGYKGYYFDWQMASNFLHREQNDFWGITCETLYGQIGRITLDDKDYAFNYSNFGMAVTGNILAQIYGDDYAAVMDDFIVSELGLERTRISNGTGDLSGYWNWRPDDAYLPAGGVISTIGDMLKYVEIHMTGEHPYLALGHEALAEVNATTDQYEKMGIRFDAMGIGWVIDAKNHVVWHNGGTSNFNSYIGFDEERQIGVVVLSNLSPSYRIPATVMGIKLMTALQATQPVD